MSYILDALRRADAERQRGAVPGLHDQAGPQAAGGMAAAPAGAPARSPWPWLAGGALLIAAVGGAWWLGRGTAATPVAAVAPPPAPVPVPVHVQVQLTPAAVAPSPALPPALPPAPPAAVLPPRADAPPAAAVAPRGGSPLPAPATVAATPAPAVPLPAASAALPAAVAADVPADPVRPWASLPDSTRSAMPALAWSGAVHAERAEQRLVIVNGNVAREGDTIAGGVQLLQIRPKSVLLRWQGQRIEMPL